MTGTHLATTDAFYSGCCVGFSVLSLVQCSAMEQSHVLAVTDTVIVGLCLLSRMFE
jgi:hypothetical protein